jgi:hypothetical protein
VSFWLLSYQNLFMPGGGISVLLVAGASTLALAATLRLVWQPLRLCHWFGGTRQLQLAGIATGLPAFAALPLVWQPCSLATGLALRTAAGLAAGCCHWLQ